MSGASRPTKKIRSESLNPSDSKKPRVFAVYTYKGGAGKTTTVINISSVLAKENKKKVLVVDCDPQCNLTSFFFPNPEDIEEQQEGEEEHNAYDTESDDMHPAEDPSEHVFPNLPFIKTDLIAEEVEAQGLDLFRDGFRDPKDHKPNVYQILMPLMERGDYKLDMDGIVSSIEKNRKVGDTGDDFGLWVLDSVPNIINLERILSRRKEDSWYPMAKS